MKLKTLFTSLIILGLIPFASSQAQDTFAPDRPGLGNGTHVAQPRITYFETGLEYFEGGSIDQFSFGQVLFRHGLTQGVELRAQLNSFVVQTRPLDNETGVPDPAVGLKFNLADKPGSPFKLSGLGSVSIPAGYSTFTDDQFHPSFTLLADFQLSELWAVTSNLGYRFGPSGTADRLTLTVTPGFSVPDSRYGGYFGYAGFLWEVENEHFIEAGLTKKVGQNLQLDLNGGIDLNSGNLFAGFGLAAQF